MKKVVSIIGTSILPCLAHAQGGLLLNMEMNMEVFRVCASIVAVGLFMLFILAIMRYVINYRLKNRIVEKGVSESVAASILQTNTKENLNSNIKWFAILTGIGAGLTIVYYTLPLHIHSLAIMAFSMGISFLAYYLFLKYSGK